MMFFSSIHLLVNDKISFFMAEYNSIVYNYHIFLINSSVVWHLGCFYNLSIVNSAAINMGVKCLWNNLCLIPLGTSPGVGLLEYMANLCLDF
jgi:hypothetical protein